MKCLNPDYWLHGHRRGALASKDAHDIEAHLLRCRACYIERAVVRAFDELTEEDNDQQIVTRVTAGALAELRARKPSLRELRIDGARNRLGRMAAAAAALALVGAGTAAAARKFWWTYRSEGDHPVQSQVRVSPSRLSSTLQKREEEVLSERMGEDFEEPAWIEPTDSSDLKTRGHRTLRSTATRSESEEEVPEERLSAEDLLTLANRQRAEGKYHLAARTYGDLVRQHPGSRAQAVARIALGRLLLDQLENPAAALDQFEGYLVESPRGGLREEARVGRALSFRRLGRTMQERFAWQDLLDHHPGSAHAVRAQARLRELRSIDN